MSDGRDIITLVAQRQDCEQFRRKNWVGTFAEYLDIVREQPAVTRTAYQRLYDMILSYGVDVTESGARSIPTIASSTIQITTGATRSSAWTCLCTIS